MSSRTRGHSTAKTTHQTRQRSAAPPRQESGSEDSSNDTGPMTGPRNFLGEPISFPINLAPLDPVWAAGVEESSPVRIPPPQVSTAPTARVDSSPLAAARPPPLSSSSTPTRPTATRVEALPPLVQSQPSGLGTGMDFP